MDLLRDSESPVIVLFGCLTALSSFHQSHHEFSEKINIVRIEDKILHYKWKVTSISSLCIRSLPQ